ncbi:MAG: hypothetical protein R3A50_04830 [Saprospiraceae bacterium]
MDDKQNTPPVPPQLEEMPAIWKWILNVIYNQGLPIILLVGFAYFQQNQNEKQQTQINQLTQKVDDCMEARINELKLPKHNLTNGKEEKN